MNNNQLSLTEGQNMELDKIKRDAETRQLALFDYGTLDLDTRSFVQTKISEIKDLIKYGIPITIGIGKKLIEVKNRFESKQLFAPDEFIEEKGIEIDKFLRDAAIFSIEIGRIAHLIYKKLGYDKYIVWIIAKNGLGLSEEFGKKALQVNELYEYAVNIEDIPRNKLFFISEGLLLPEFDEEDK